MNGQDTFWKVMIYHSLKTLVAFFGLFVGLSWFTTGSLGIIDSFSFALWITICGGILLSIVFKIAFPQLNRERPEERKEMFKHHQMAIKLIFSLTISFSLFLIFFWIYPVLRYDFSILPNGFMFWETVAASLGIGFLFAGLATLAIWLFIRLEKPPF